MKNLRASQSMVDYFKKEQEAILKDENSTNKEESKQETQGYICPQTKKQCDDECCVSAKDCHLEASMGVLSEPKQETLEEAARNYAIKKRERKHLSNREFDLCQKDFIAGAKWQQERSYSGEDVYNILVEHTIELFKEESQTLDEFFNKFKKK